MKQKNAREDARAQAETCRKRPRETPECAKAHSLHLLREKEIQKNTGFFMKRKTETLFFGQTENLHEQGKIKGREREGRRRNFAFKLSKRRVL